MRSEEVAIMVGKNTVMHDNPKLTTRLVKGKNPVRIFIDQHLEVPLNFNIYNKEAETIVFNGKKNEIVDNIKFLQIDFNGHVLKHILDKLYQMNIQSILVEGGSKLLNYFIEDGIYDELSVFENKELVFGKGIKAPSIKNKPH